MAVIRMSGPIVQLPCPVRSSRQAAPRREIAQRFDKAKVHAEFDPDIRIVRQEFGKRRPENRLRRVHPGGDTDRPGGLVAKLAECGKLGLDFVKARTDGEEQSFSCVCWRNT